MKERSQASIFGIAAAALVACASKHPVSSSESQSVIDNAVSQMVCRREPVTGSHIYREVCLTLAQREAEHERSVELMRDMQRRAAATSQPMPNPPTRVPSAAARRP